ncbi:unnamed protein product [Miscanthus lutarioriparius]|uniref:C3H1-type domain-containing protein n=1 Tax=Miscanthus lutarioriparius TaxID=422564 RepID=A0A811SH04_9POAL|nr:unnamed protein product [Miscanthus lutarioriparius]
MKFSLSDFLDDRGFCGVTAAEKKPMMQSRDVDKYLNKADNASHVLMNSDDTSIIGGRCLHVMHGLGTQLDSDAQRLSSSSPGENLDNKIRRPSKLCTFDAQGRCKKGRSCISLHEREGIGSAKAGLLAPAGSGNHRGFEEGSQVQHKSDLKLPQFKDSKGLSKDEMYRNLIYAFGKDNQMSAHLAGKHSSPNPGVSQRMPVSIGDSLTEKPTAHANELAQNPVVHEKNNKRFMGHHIGLAAENYLDARGTYPRLDGGNFQFGMDKGSSDSDSHVSRTYLSNYPYQSFGLPVSSDPLQLGEKLSAYDGATMTIPNIHQKEHHSFHASYGSHSLTGSGNPCFATSECSFGSPSLLATSHLGIQSHHLFTSDIEKADLHRYLDIGKGCGTSSSGPALLVGSEPEPYIMPVGPHSPIKDEVWETSVPFVPSFSFPDNTTPSESQYDPFVDYVEPPKVGNTNNLKPSNISSNISSQHTNQYANAPACLIAPDRERSSSLDDIIKVKAYGRKKDAAYNNEKTRDFRFHLAEHIKELVKPIWKKGNLSKDAHRLVVKKSVEKVVDSIEPNQVPTTEELITKYIGTCGPKIEKLVKAYVDRHSTACHPTFKYSSTEMGA